MIVVSIEDDWGLRCVDLTRHVNGQVTFKEFRRDPEDGGRWTLVADYSLTAYASTALAINAACTAIPWMAERRSRPNN